MSFDKLKEQIALLRLANLTPFELDELSCFILADAGTLEDLGWEKCETAERLKLDRQTMSRERKRLVGAACQMLLMEHESQTPFDRWLVAHDGQRLTPYEIALMRKAFEAGGKQNG